MTYKRRMGQKPHHAEKLNKINDLTWDKIPHFWGVNTPLFKSKTMPKHAL